MRKSSGFFSVINGELVDRIKLHEYLVLVLFILFFGSVVSYPIYILSSWDHGECYVVSSADVKRPKLYNRYNLTLSCDQSDGTKVITHATDYSGTIHKTKKVFLEPRDSEGAKAVIWYMPYFDIFLSSVILAGLITKLYFLLTKSKFISYSEANRILREGKQLTITLEQTDQLEELHDLINKGKKG